MISFLLAHWEMILAIIGNVIGWGKCFIKLLDWIFRKRKTYYECALKTCGWSDQYLFGTYFELKTKLHNIIDHIDGKLSGKKLAEYFSTVYLDDKNSKLMIDYNYFDRCANLLNKNWKLSRKLRKLNNLLLCNFTKDGIKTEAHEIRTLANDCLCIIDSLISKYQLSENNKNAI